MNNIKKSIIFISHRSIDKNFADILVDFLCGTGIPKDRIFCSSLPGNDVKEKISNEIKIALKNSIVNICIFSRAYYQSAYCLNEAGIIWFKDVCTIPIALPEIDNNNMFGFINNEYKLRRLDIDTDITYIYDTIQDLLILPQTKISLITREAQKLKERYGVLIKDREYPSSSTLPIEISDFTTDDEKIVLYYILTENTRKVYKTKIKFWLQQNEIYDVDINNAFDLLASFDGQSTNELLELGIKTFRQLSKISNEILPLLENQVKKHIKLASEIFFSLWNSDKFNDTIKLFVLYIIEEKVNSFGDRWMGKIQCELIEQWEQKNCILSNVSENYYVCLETFKNYNFLFESEWTSYGNPREYTLYPSLQNFLLVNCPKEILLALQELKNKYTEIF